MDKVLVTITEMDFHGTTYDSIQFQLNPNDKEKDLLNQLSKDLKQCFDHFNLRIVFNDKVLESEGTLNSCGIKEGSTMHLKEMDCPSILKLPLPSYFEM